MTMAFNSLFCLYLFYFFVGLASSSVLISNDVFNSRGHGGRALLQVQKSCSVPFEAQNYTVITSHCKGPQYPKDQCCNALKEFACPFRDAINDLTTDCASTMFSYINLYGKYPPGLFANMCREGKDGLDCGSDPATNRAHNHRAPLHPTILLMLIVVFTVLLLQLF
ncbi:hypothetical protein CFOL_v3_13922 [Cephalotus follicularis]|uniref:GPI-anchored protein LLG1-like domain-containing protein n=1 Tax=Cephalotus follicularis TaxID=3775 RepID=A0A1Q3BRD2_CEPFO|nr:hypothetical protein CFOL_v3_13922 [Cephalotus follicularis]